MLIKIGHISDSTRFGLQHVKPQTLVHNPSSNLVIFNLNEKQGLSILNSYTRLQRHNKNKRIYVVYSGVEPGIPPSGPPHQNILSWAVALALGVVIPFISYKWGPTLKEKIEMIMQKTEDVAEAVEKVAEKVEKVAEDIIDDLPEGGKLREAAEFVEKMAERARIDAGVVDDFIDKAQEEEEKKIEESLKDEPKTALDETKIKKEDPKQNN
ncbi:hypothetical protein CASFOL_016783 [Castilleja foliolosa]|uniref:Uncharacterized protein n=1 Tax=Castilleja foliolosa TaxID=1961234 RepID=A0ABD3DD56_9LAMI